MLTTVNTLAKMLDQVLSDPDIALGYAQGVLERTLESNGIDKRLQDGVLYYEVRGMCVSVAEYDTKTGTLIWRMSGTTQQQDKIIKAHCSLWSNK